MVGMVGMVGMVRAGIQNRLGHPPRLPAIAEPGKRVLTPLQM